VVLCVFAACTFAGASSAEMVLRRAVPPELKHYEGAHCSAENPSDKKKNPGKAHLDGRHFEKFHMKLNF
jgi:hypothetical protein